MTEPSLYRRLRTRIADKIESFEELANWVSDREHNWWPFGALQPKPEQRMSNGRVVMLSMAYGIPAALFAVVLGKILGEAPEPRHLVLLPLCACVGFFIVYRTTFAYFWNRRAGKLQTLSERRLAWREGRLHGCVTAQLPPE